MMDLKEGVTKGVNSLHSLELKWTMAFPAKVISLCAMLHKWKNYYLLAILATVLAFAVTASASAQNPKTPEPPLGGETTDSIRQLYEVTVTSKQPVRTIATSQTLSGADLQALSTTSVADALKYFAGVQIKDYGGLGGLKTINVRS